jgi:hypothetical protein
MVTGCSCSDIAGAGLMRIVQGPVRTGCLLRKNNGGKRWGLSLCGKTRNIPGKKHRNPEKTNVSKNTGSISKKKYRTVPG